MVKDKIKNALGNILIDLQPQRAADLSKRGMTIMDTDTFSLADRLMRDSLLKKVENNSDFETLAKFQKNYWINKGSEYFQQNDGSFENAFLPECTFIFDELQELLAKNKVKYNTVVEIGTGNGKVLNYLADKFPQIDKLIGIDLSADQIKINRTTYSKNKRLHFVASDGMDWVKTNGANNMIFVTSRGVLEYFTEEKLGEFLKTINNLGDTIFVAIEPNGVDHNFEVNPNSQPYGVERSFSHNYASLFKKAGFHLWHYSKKEYGRDDFFFRFIGAKS